ncbi:MAG: hypothetical protein RL131_284 [Bacteroidota bacterium]
MKRGIFLFLFLLSINWLFGQEINVVHRGAVGDGVKDNGKLFQQIIDELSLKGGGRIIVPAGQFLISPIQLKSKVELHLQKGARLLGSIDRDDYGIPPLSLIKVLDADHVKITGSGVIDGRGRELMKEIFKKLEAGLLQDSDWKVKRPTESNRAHVVYMKNSEHVEVRGVEFRDASTWVLKIINSDQLVFDQIRVESTAYWNNDGIDLDNCKNVRVTNSYFNTADDAICLKSESRDGFCDSIWIENCTLRSSASAFKMGTASYGGFKNITVKNIRVFDTYRSAIALEAVDGGFIENIDISGVKAVNTGNAIFIKLGKRNKDDVYSRVENIRIRDVYVEIPAGKPDAGYEMEGPVLKYPPGFVQQTGKIVSVSPWNHSTKETSVQLYPHNVFPASISGLPGHYIKNVILENIEMVYQGGGDRRKAFMPIDSLHIITEAADSYPEFSMFGELPVWGLFLRHAEGVALQNVRLKILHPDYRPAVALDDVRKVDARGLLIEGSSSKPDVHVIRSSGVLRN